MKLEYIVKKFIENCPKGRGLFVKTSDLLDAVHDHLEEIGNYNVLSMIYLHKIMGDYGYYKRRTRAGGIDMYIFDGITIPR